MEQVVASWMRDYTAGGENIRFHLRTLPFEDALLAVRAGEVDVLISASEPPAGWFAVILREEPIAVFVHPDNNVQNLSLDELHLLFTGEADSWEQLGGSSLTVQAVIPPPGDELRQRFAQIVMGKSAFDPDAYLAPSPDLANKLVAQQEGAASFLPALLVSGEVRALNIEDIPLPAAMSADGYPLKLQIFAASPREPAGPLRDWLIWLQNQRGEATQAPP